MIIYDNKIYIYGGFTSSFSLSDFYSLNLLNLVWTKENPTGQIPSNNSLRDFSFVRVGTKLFITGGCDFEAKKCYTDTYSIDITTLIWSKITDSNSSSITGRYGFRTIFFKGGIYSFGGCEMYKQCFNDVYFMDVQDICPNKCIPPQRNAIKGVCNENIG